MPSPSPSPPASATASPGTLSSSFATIPSASASASDSENYSSPPSPDAAPPSESSTSSPLILYKPPTLWGLLRGAAINLLLPFVNGLMLGFGELVANEAAYRLGWSGTKIFPTHRSAGGGHRVGPGVEMRADPVERRRRDGGELDMYTALE